MKPSTLENTRSLDYRPSVPTNTWFPSNCDLMTIHNFEEYDEPMKRMGNATTAPGIPLRLRQSVRTFPRGRGQACMEGGTPPYDPWCLDTIPYKPGRGPCARKASLGRARMVGRTPHTGHIPRLRGPFAWTVLNSHRTVWAWLYLSVKRVSRIHAHTTYRVILSPSKRTQGLGSIFGQSKYSKLTKSPHNKGPPWTMTHFYWAVGGGLLVDFRTLVGRFLPGSVQIPLFWGWTSI